MCEDAVFDNETSGDKLLRSERMVYTNEAVPDSRLQDIYYLAERGNPIYMDDKKLLRYSMQLSMLKQLLSKKLISENEYQIIQKKLMKDYGIISNITA